MRLVIITFIMCCGYGCRAADAPVIHAVSKDICEIAVTAEYTADAIHFDYDSDVMEFLHLMFALDSTSNSLILYDNLNDNLYRYGLNERKILIRRNLGYKTISNLGILNGSLVLVMRDKLLRGDPATGELTDEIPLPASTILGSGYKYITTSFFYNGLLYLVYRNHAALDEGVLVEYDGNLEKRNVIRYQGIQGAPKVLYNGHLVTVMNTMLSNHGRISPTYGFLGQSEAYCLFERINSDYRIEHFVFDKSSNTVHSLVSTFMPDHCIALGSKRFFGPLVQLDSTNNVNGVIFKELTLQVE